MEAVARRLWHGDRETVQTSRGDLWGYKGET